jgi:hypothetical protein
MDYIELLFGSKDEFVSFEGIKAQCQREGRWFLLLTLKPPISFLWIAVRIVARGIYFVVATVALISLMLLCSSSEDGFPHTASVIAAAAILVIFFLYESW